MIAAAHRVTLMAIVPPLPDARARLTLRNGVSEGAG
jgi:hypothetical protein